MKQYFTEYKEPCYVRSNVNKTTGEKFYSWVFGRRKSEKELPSKMTTMTKDNGNGEYEKVVRTPGFYTGINFDKGIEVDGYNLVCLDLDVKHIQEEEQRNRYFIEVMDKFDLPLDYPNVERTKSKGYHIWVLVPSEEVREIDGILWTKKVYVMDPVKKVELEIFVSEYGVVVYDRKSLNKQTMLELKELPSINFVEVVKQIKKSTTNRKDYDDVEPETEEDLKRLYKKIYADPKRDYSSLTISRIKNSNVYIVKSWSRENELLRVEKLTHVYKFLEVSGRPGAKGYSWNPKTGECKLINKK